MSEMNERKVAGPPPRIRRADQGGSRLVKANRVAAQEDEQQRTSAGTADLVESLPARDQPSTVSDPVQESLTRGDERTTVSFVSPEATEAAVPSIASAAGAAPTPAAAEANKLVNATYRVPADLKKRLNSAISAAKTFEGWTSAEELVQDLFEREIKRIQDEYNNGEPFPLRTKAMPRGRMIQPSSQ